MKLVGENMERLAGIGWKPSRPRFGFRICAARLHKVPVDLLKIVGIFGNIITQTDDPSTATRRHAPPGNSETQMNNPEFWKFFDTEAYPNLGNTPVFTGYQAGWVGF
jgi:hypothetical protein